MKRTKFTDAQIAFGINTFINSRENGDSVSRSLIKAGATGKALLAAREDELPFIVK